MRLYAADLIIIHRAGHRLFSGPLLYVYFDFIILYGVISLAF